MPTPTDKPPVPEWLDSLLDQHYPGQSYYATSRALDFLAAVLREGGCTELDPTNDTKYQQLRAWARAQGGE